MPELRKSRLAESPWFWLALAIFWAVLALAAITPKYMQRQARLNRQQQARELAWQRRLAAGQEVQSASADSLEARGFGSARAWSNIWLPAAICCTLVLGVAGAGLLFARRRRFDAPRASRHGAEESFHAVPDTSQGP